MATFKHKQLREQSLAGAVSVHDEVTFSNQLLQELENRGFFSVKLEPAPGKPYIKAHATFVCDKVGLVEIDEFFGLNASENSIGNKLLRYQEFYFKCREMWEEHYGNETRSESKETSSAGA